MIYNSCNSKSYLDPFFEAFFGKGTANNGYLPMKTDVYESDAAYRLDVEAPGFKKENFDIRKMIRGVIFIITCLTLPRRELSGRVRDIFYLVILLPIIVDAIYRRRINVLNKGADKEAEYENPASYNAIR